MKVTAAVCWVWHVCFNAGLNVSAGFGKWLISLPPPHLWKAADAVENMAAYYRREGVCCKYARQQTLLREAVNWWTCIMRQQTYETAQVRQLLCRGRRWRAGPLLRCATVYHRRQALGGFTQDKGEGANAYEMQLLGGAVIATKSLESALWNHFFPPLVFCPTI